MPVAHQGEVKYHYLDHDGVSLELDPPVQNTWYEVFHDYDVRLLWCVIVQYNDEHAAKDVEVKWTIDGQVYLLQTSLADDDPRRVWKSWLGSLMGTNGLAETDSIANAAYYVDKRGQDFKVEIRMTSVPGTDQRLIGYATYETLEQT